MDRKTTIPNEIFIASKAWRETYPGAVVGVLAMDGVSNPEQNAALDKRKEDLIKALRSKLIGKDRAAINALPTMRAYSEYYI